MDADSVALAFGVSFLCTGSLLALAAVFLVREYRRLKRTDAIG